MAKPYLYKRPLVNNGLILDFQSPTVQFPLLSCQYCSILSKKNIDSVFPVIRYGYPIQRALVVDENKRIKMREPKYFSSRSQDLEPFFHDAGQFYFFEINKVLEQKSLWTKNTGFIEISELEGQDIDEEMDWKLAELKYKLKEGA